jgi:hypothetical protein
MGKATLYVNWELYLRITLNETKINIPDITLYQFWNTILIYFESESPNSNLLCPNRQKQPELEFKFN